MLKNLGVIRVDLNGGREILNGPNEVFQPGLGEAAMIVQSVLVSRGIRVFEPFSATLDGLIVLSDFIQRER